MPGLDMGRAALKEKIQGNESCCPVNAVIQAV